MKLIDYLINKHNIRREEAAWMVHLNSAEGVFNLLYKTDKDPLGLGSIFCGNEQKDQIVV